MEIPSLIEQLCLNISKSNSKTSDALALGRLVRFNKTNRKTTASVGGLQALTSALSSSARISDLKSVEALANTLAYLALDNDNKAVLVSPIVQGGGCDVLAIVQLCLYQLNKKHSAAGTASKYIAPPTHAGVPIQCLCSLSRLVWNVSNIESEYELDGICGSTNTNGGEENERNTPSLATLLVSEFVWLSDQLNSKDEHDKSKEKNYLEVEETRFQILGALWSLSTTCRKWNDMQAKVWVALLATVLHLIDQVTKDNETPEKGDGDVTGGCSTGLHLASTRSLCTAAVGLMGNLLDHELLKEHVIDLNGSDDVLFRLLTKAKEDDAMYVAVLGQKALVKLSGSVQ